MATRNVLNAVVFITVLITVDFTSGQNYDDWIVTAHKIGDSITLNCSNYCENAEANGCHPRQEIPPEFDLIRSWMGPAPQLHVWDVNQLDISNISNDECPTCEIGIGGHQFFIKRFQPSHIGIYHCMYYNISLGRYYLVKWGVNMRGPYFEDLLEKYEQNIIIGFSAFGGFLFVAISILLVYRFRWRPDDDEEDTSKPYEHTINSFEPAKFSGVYGVDATDHGQDGVINLGYMAEKSTFSPEGNELKADVQVHNGFGGGPEKRSSRSSSSSDSSNGEVEPEKDLPLPPTPHPAFSDVFEYRPSYNPVDAESKM